MKAVTCVIPHAYTVRWTQITVQSLLQHRNDADMDILIVDNSPIGNPSIRGITETPYGEKVRVVPSKDLVNTGHQLALDHAIDLVDTPWFLSWETDVRAMRDGWLDWMLSHVKDDFVAMAGWYWDAGFEDGRHYISPAGALYRTSVLKSLKEECLRNKDLSVCYGRDMSKRINLATEYPHTAGMLIPQGNWGPFSECRGFGNVYPFPEVEQWTPEPGNWIFNRCEMQWECVRLPGGMVMNEQAQETGIPHKHTFVGPFEDPYFIHYWGGTVSHNFDKHNIYDFDIPKLWWWLRREYDMWEAVVPEEIRRQTIDMGIVRPIDDELAYAMTKVVPWK
jgi:hypothetical protein